jgi:hypothetical protein
MPGSLAVTWGTKVLAGFIFPQPPSTGPAREVSPGDHTSVASRFLHHSELWVA